MISTKYNKNKEIYRKNNNIFLSFRRFLFLNKKCKRKNVFNFEKNILNEIKSLQFVNCLTDYANY